MAKSRDEFSAHVIKALKQRAAFICSNPTCKNLTVAPAEASEEDVLYSGRAAHIYAAAEGGPRYGDMTEEERSDISNAIFLCANCADIVDDNNGADFAPELLKKWKVDHEAWIKANLNKSVFAKPATVINVTSTNQQGGITAGIVNIGTVGRHLNDQLKQELDTTFPNVAEKIGVMCATGDSEGFNFANEILGYMREKGFVIQGVSQGTVAPPVRNVQIRTTPIIRIPHAFALGQSENSSPKTIRQIIVGFK